MLEAELFGQAWEQQFLCCFQNLHFGTENNV